MTPQPPAAHAHAPLRRLLQLPAWAWVGMLLGLVMLGLTVVSSPAMVEGAVSVQNATVTHMGIAQAATKSVALSHTWDDEKPPWTGTARYAIAWPAGLGTASTALSASPSYALYLPRVGARFRVFLNDHMIASEHWETQGYVDTSVVPYVVPLPAALMAQPLSGNRIAIEVQGQLLRKSGLSAVLIGPREAMEARHQKVYAWQVQATWMVTACSAFLALLAGLMWAQNRERVFGLLALASMAWAVRLGLTPLVNPPMPFELWFYLHKLSFTLYCGFVYLFLWDIFDFRQGWGRKLVLCLLWVGPVWIGIITLTENYNLYRIWTGIIAVVSFITLMLMFIRARWGLDQNQRLMVVVGLVTMVAGLRDFAVVQLGAPGDADIRWMTLGSLVFMLTLAWILVQRTSGYMQQIGQLNHNLEQRVAQKESELHAVFDKLRESERRQVLETERQRLTRDMHDGLGSQLVQTLNVVRGQGHADPQTITAMINHALEELRMTLDSLEPMEGDLPAILGTLRRRISPALEAAGIELDWQVQEVPPIAVHGQPLESRGVMHLFRFLQEAFANIIKHAQASRVEVRTWSVQDADGQPRVVLAVTDNGRGLGAGYREGGRGMENLRARAVALDAQLRLGPASLTQPLPGTRVELEFASTVQKI